MRASRRGAAIWLHARHRRATTPLKMSALPPGEATAEYDHKLFNAAAHHGTAVPETPPHVLSEETIEALKKVNSTAVVDVLARNGYEPRTCYMENVRSMQSGQRLVARAVTVRFVPARADAMAEKPSGEDSPEYAAFERAGPGDCIVMEAMRTKLMSVGGDIKFLRLKQNGVDGLVCDGGIRDMHVAKDYGPLFFGYDKTSNLGTRIGTPYATNDVIAVDNVLVRPGDYILADDDGVVVIPRVVAPKIAELAIEYDDLEEWIRSRLDRENLTPGKYYPPDETVMAEYRAEKAVAQAKL